jgi:hypothetical protein
MNHEVRWHLEGLPHVRIQVVERRHEHEFTAPMVPNSAEFDVRLRTIRHDLHTSNSREACFIRCVADVVGWSLVSRYRAPCPLFRIFPDAPAAVC